MRTFLFSLTLVAVAALIGTNSYAQCASMPVITASGPTTFCLGNSVTLTASASGSWSKRADFIGGALSYVSSFSIGNKGYFAGGGIGRYGLTAGVWQFDATTNTWSQVADFGGAGRSRATAFAIGDKGYMGFGFNPGYHSPTSTGSGYFTIQNRDFWEYDPSANTWTRKADLPSDEREYATGFAIGKKGYVGLGRATYNNVDYDLNDFWEYDPSTDTWTRKRNFEGALTYDFGYIVRESAVGFAIGTKGYVGTGYGKDDYYADATLKNSFWEFDPIANIWTKKADFGGTARSGAVGFSLGSKGYIGTGNDGNPKKDFWEYDPGTDTWIQRIDFGGAARNDAGAFTIGSKAYIGTGNGSSGQMNDFWEYTPPGNYTYSWSPGMQTTPSIVASSAGDYKVTVTGGDGCSTVSSATTTVTVISPLVPPAIACYQTAAFDEGSCRWVITGTQPAKPAMECYQTATFNNTTCSWDVAGSPPVITASGPTSFCSGGSVTLSTATGNSWTQKTSFGGTARSGAVGFAIGNKAYIGTGFDGYWVGDFWEYDPAANTWTQKYTPSDFWRSDAVAFAIGGKGYMGTGYNNSTQEKNDFWEYDPTTNIWSRKADFGGVARENAVGFSIGSKGYIGTGQNGSTCMSDFWEYDPATNAWTRKADFVGGARAVATSFSAGSKGYIGTGFSTVGNIDKSDFWEYDPLTNAWTKKADFGGGVRESATGFSIGTKGYIGGGYGPGRQKDFWEYDPATDAWTKKADFGGTARAGAVGFSLGSKGYIGTGNDGSKKNDFWEYDPRVFNYSSYSWSPGGQTTPSIVVNSSGSYTITTTYAPGCSLTSDAVTVTVNQPPAMPATLCYQTATFNQATCSWDITGKQPDKPATACYETATFNTTTCKWDVTGTQPPQPANVNCWDNYVLDATSCSWVNMGTEPVKPVTACYQKATFNTTTCKWDVTGTKPAKPITPCYKEAIFDNSTCQWIVQFSGFPDPYPSEAFTPTCTGDAEGVTSEGYAGEFSLINVIAGTSYTFTSSVSTDIISIANSDATTSLASGTTPVTWVSNVTGTIRFYTNTSDCGIDYSLRTRSVTCNAMATPPAITNVTVPSNSCVVASHTINADINTAVGTISSAIINYNNGALGTATMSLTSGSTYSSTIPAGSAGVPVTWSITAISSNGGSTTVTGSSYTDGIQPTKPTNVNCWDNYVFNTTSCSWVNIGTQPTQPAMASYQTASFNTTTCQWDVTGTKPTATIVLSNLTQVYDGSSKNVTVTTTPADLTVNITYNNNPIAPINAGSYNVMATIVDANYQGSASGNLVISKADPTITWSNPAAITYGTALSATQLNASTSGDGALTYTLTSGTVLNAGTQILTVNAAPTTNYNAASKDVILVVNKATPTISVMVGGPFTYDGTAKSVQSATVTGVNNTSLSGASVVYKLNGTAVSPVNAGSYTVIVSYAEGANYLAASDNTNTLTIIKATPIVTPTVSTYSYTGLPQGPNTASNSGSGTSYTFSYAGSGTTTYAANSTAPTNAGTYTVTATVAASADGNYALSSSNATPFTIGKATPTVTVTNVGTYTYTGLSQGPNTASNSGTGTSYTFSYAGSGTTTYAANSTAPTNAGTYTVTATVAASADGNYALSSSNATPFTIGKATPVITLTVGAAVTYDGQPHYVASATVAGVNNTSLGSAVVAYTTGTPASGVTNPSNAGVYAVTADYAATTNYNAAVQKTGTLTINKASATIVVKPYSVTYDGNSHTATATATGAKGEALTGLSLNTTHTAAGTYGSDSWSFTDATGNYNNVAVTTITDKINPLAITIRPNPNQNKFYSCQTDPVITYTNSPALIGTDAFSGALSRATPTITNAGTYAITLGSLTAGPNYSLTLSTPPVTFEIKPQSAKPTGQAFYTGASIFWTPNSTSNSATLTLSATLQNTGSCGDIRTAKVSFMIRTSTGLTPVAGAQNLPVGLVNTADQSVGTASVNVQYSVNSTTQLDIAVIIGGNYAANDPKTDAIITVAIPKPGGQIVGDGRVCNDKSSGYVAGAPGTQSWFGFNVQYTKSLTNLQGGVDMTVISMNDRNGNPTTTPHIYKFRSNAISTLSVTSPTASFSGKANVTEVLTDGTEQSIEGNCTMQLDITDNGSLTPSTDRLGITIYRAKGGVWYSNNWEVNKTTQATICFGDLSTTGASTTSPAITTIAANTQSVAAAPAPQLFTERFSATAYPNPTVSQFTIKVSSGNTKDPITLRVIDEVGRLVEVKNNLADGQTIQIGQAYHSGAYFVDVMQGNTRRQLKLIKNK